MRTMPDTEALVGDWLRSDDDVQALAEGRVYSAVPAQPTWPLLTLNRWGGTQPVPGWLDRVGIALDAWAETKADARALIATALAALLLLNGVHDNGVVAYVEIESGPGWNPDPATNRPRYTAHIAVSVHPIA